MAISTYDGHRKYLPKAIESAKGAEILVIDNGFACEDLAEGTRYFGREPTGFGGQVESRLVALREATGDYIIHLDADDWLFELPTPRGDWYFSDFYLCEPDDSIVGMWDFSGFPRDLQGAIDLALARIINPTPMKAAFRTQWLRDKELTWCQFPNAWFADDMRTALEYHKHSPEVVYSPDPFYVYRRHPEQWSQKYSKDELKQDLVAYLQGESCTETSTP